MWYICYSIIVSIWNIDNAIMDWKGYNILEVIDSNRNNSIIWNVLYYVMTNDTSTPELVKKVSYYNEKLNDAIPDWADMNQMYIHYDLDKIFQGKFQRNKERESIKTLFYFICINFYFSVAIIKIVLKNSAGSCLSVPKSILSHLPIQVSNL